MTITVRVGMVLYRRFVVGTFSALARKKRTMEEEIFILMKNGAEKQVHEPTQPWLEHTYERLRRGKGVVRFTEVAQGVPTAEVTALVTSIGSIEVRKLNCGGFYFG